MEVIVPVELQEKRKREIAAEETQGLAEPAAQVQAVDVARFNKENEAAVQARLNGYVERKNDGKPSLTSFIAPEDEQEARELIRSILGFDPIRPTGFDMLISIYVRPELILNKEGKVTGLVRPEGSTAMDQYRRSVGLVLDFGPLCWKHPRFDETGPWCRVGDWIVVPRNEGQTFKDRGLPMMLIADYNCRAVVQDPYFIEEA